MKQPAADSLCAFQGETLFSLDMNDYDPSWPRFVRPSVRAVILRGGKIAMVHSLKYDYYKFPGGGPEPGEDDAAALTRETAEESGLAVIPESIRPLGRVPRLQRSFGKNVIFEQDNRYYLCDVLPSAGSTRLDDYEREERFTLEWVTPDEAIRTNARPHTDSSVDSVMLVRERRVLEILKERFFPTDK